MTKTYAATKETAARRRREGLTRGADKHSSSPVGPAIRNGKRDRARGAGRRDANAFPSDGRARLVRRIPNEPLSGRYGRVLEIVWVFNEISVVKRSRRLGEFG